MKLILLIRMLPIMCGLTFTHFGIAKESSKNVSLPGNAVNRSVLTVGRLAFTALDAYALLSVWNSAQKEKTDLIKIQTNWLEPLEVGASDQNDFDKSIEQWPSDVKQLFMIALVWIDVQKLNLFIPKPEELSSGSQVFDDFFKKNSDQIPEIIRSQIFTSSQKQRQLWVEMVIRTRSFLRIRGGFERNKGLMDVGWYWHGFPKGGER